MSFILLFKFEIDNGRNDMVMELPEPLIDWGKDSGLNEWHGYMPFLLQNNKRKRLEWIIDGGPRLLKPSNIFWGYEFPFFFFFYNHVL
jgi:hypothetical protein